MYSAILMCSTRGCCCWYYYSTATTLLWTNEVLICPAGWMNGEIHSSNNKKTPFAGLWWAAQKKKHCIIINATINSRFLSWHTPYHAIVLIPHHHSHCNQPSFPSPSWSTASVSGNASWIAIQFSYCSMLYIVHALRIFIPFTWMLYLVSKSQESSKRNLSVVLLAGD